MAEFVLSDWLTGWLVVNEVCAAVLVDWVAGWTIWLSDKTNVKLTKDLFMQLNLSNFFIFITDSYLCNNGVFESAGDGSMNGWVEYLVPHRDQVILELLI